MRSGCIIKNIYIHFQKLKFYQDDSGPIQEYESLFSPKIGRYIGYTIYLFL